MSTQANATNKYSVKFWADCGVSRIVLARELSVEICKHIQILAVHYVRAFFVLCQNQLFVVIVNFVNGVFPSASLHTIAMIARDFEGLEEYLQYLDNIGVDAVIVSDPGIIVFCKKVLKKTQIHLSTQANAHYHKKHSHLLQCCF